MMNTHPGGREATRSLLARAQLPAGATVLDMGAGAGETLALLRERGYDARGIDLDPRTDAVERADLLQAPFPDAGFDAVISECAFFVSGDVPGALREARRLLKSGGKLLLADVFFAPPQPLLEAAGFSLLHAEDVTPQWREYYLEALWREDALCCALPRGKCSYWLLIAERR